MALDSFPSAAPIPYEDRRFSMLPGVPNDPFTQRGRVNAAVRCSETLQYSSPPRLTVVHARWPLSRLRSNRRSMCRKCRGHDQALASSLARLCPRIILRGDAQEFRPVLYPNSTFVALSAGQVQPTVLRYYVRLVLTRRSRQRSCENLSVHRRYCSSYGSPTCETESERETNGR